jgi:hypothetical protein
MKRRLVKMRRAVFRRRTLVTAAICLVSLWVALSFYHSYKRLPTGLVYRGETRSVAAEDVELLIDVTYRKGNTRVIEQQIYDRVLEMIDHARRLVVLDIFLLNAHQGAKGEIYRPLSAEVTERLLTKRRTHPEMPILLITDPINDVYGGEPSPQLASLRQAGVQVVVTDLDRLRDSNPLYSGPWRTLGKWWQTPEPGGKLPNPLDSSAPPVNLRTYLRLLNFKANHRKVVLADADGSVWTTLVTSANAHDASSAHSNVALFVRGEFARQVYEAEAAVARLSLATPPFSELPALDALDRTGTFHVSYLTESAIRDRLLAVINGAQAGDEIDVAVFYLSHRRILRSLVRAAGRGASVRVVLDPNRDAFGRTKNGIPNRQSAEYLVRESDSAVEVRWVDTQGEQYHTKLLVSRSSDGIDLVLGSANFTRRNLDDLNLEANIWVQAPRGSTLDSDLEGYFDRIWNNLDGAHTAEFDTYRDPSLLRRAVARIQERTGLGTF